VVGVARGVAACARAHGIAVVGGNVTRGPALSAAITVLGAVPAAKALRRAGARPGDLLLGSGSFGDAALGLEPGAGAALCRRQRRPIPRLSLGRALLGIAHAAIDVSDGLVQDLGHLAQASGLCAVVEEARIPLSPAYRRRVRGRSDPLGPALSGGEDYELLVAVPPARLRAAERAAARAGVSLAVLGRFQRGRGVRVIGADGRERRAPRGHDHLRAPTPAFDITPLPSRIRAGGRRGEAAPSRARTR
jgi:thiamine-monophosphate kinase